MPAQMQTFLWCKSNEQFETQIVGGGGIYRCDFGPWNPGPYSVNWHCTCPAFRYSKDHSHCKHIEKAEDRRCGHGSGAASGSPATDWIRMPDKSLVCPKCAGPVVAVKVAV